MKANGQRKMLEVFKDLFLKPGLASTYRNLSDWAERSGYPALAKEAADASAAPEETEAEFNRLCIGPYRLVVIPYESAWVTSSRKLNGPVAADVANFYASAGLTSASMFNEQPDFFGNELEFLYFLEAVAEETRQKEHSEQLLKEIEGLSKSFRSEHFDKWYEVFLNAIAENTDQSFWKEASEALKAELRRTQAV